MFGFGFGFWCSRGKRRRERETMVEERVKKRHCNGAIINGILFYFILTSYALRNHGFVFVLPFWRLPNCPRGFCLVLSLFWWQTILFIRKTKTHEARQIQFGPHDWGLFVFSLGQISMSSISFIGWEINMVWGVWLFITDF